RCAVGEHVPGHTSNATVSGNQVINAMPVLENDLPFFHVCPDPAFERRYHAGARAPGNVETRHGIAVAAGGGATALRPAHHGEPTHPLTVQPGAHFPGGKIDERFRGPAWPVILFAVESGGTEPIL